MRVLMSAVISSKVEIKELTDHEIIKLLKELPDCGYVVSAPNKHSIEKYGPYDVEYMLYDGYIE